jgi:hypothetical protein
VFDTCDIAGAFAVALLGLGSVQADLNVWPHIPAYPYVTTNVAGTDNYCTYAQPGVPAKPTCPTQ